ncbi:uncharacterized protein LOC144638042 [Oculina patagonica]
MGLLTKEALDFFAHKRITLKNCCKNFMKSNDKMATKLEQDKQQVHKDKVITSDIVSQVKITATSKSQKCLQTTSQVGNASLLLPPSLLLGERIEQQGLSQETEQNLFNETFCTLCVDNSSESRTWFDIYQERNMQLHHKITAAQFNLNMSSDDTRLVNGLLTTTLCSTEL